VPENRPAGFFYSDKYFRICFARYSLISLCLGTGCDLFLFCARQRHSFYKTSDYQAIKIFNVFWVLHGIPNPKCTLNAYADSPSAFLTGYLVINPAGRPSPACPHTRLNVNLPHLMDLRSKSRQLKVEVEIKAEEAKSRKRSDSGLRYSGILLSSLTKRSAEKDLLAFQ